MGVYEGTLGGRQRDQSCRARSDIIVSSSLADQDKMQAHREDNTGLALTAYGVSSAKYDGLRQCMVTFHGVFNSVRRGYFIPIFLRGPQRDTSVIKLAQDRDKVHANLNLG